MPDGVSKLERSLALALEAGLEEHVARAYTNLATCSVAIRDYAIGRSPPRSRHRATAPSTT